jgi:hypothetical protein
MRSQMEVMAFTNRTVTSRVGGDRLSRTVARLLGLALSTSRVSVYCQQWQRVGGDDEAVGKERKLLPKLDQTKPLECRTAFGYREGSTTYNENGECVRIY